MSDTITPPKITNVQDLISVYSKIVLATSAALRRALSSSLPSLKRYSNRTFFSSKLYQLAQSILPCFKTTVKVTPHLLMLTLSSWENVKKNLTWRKEKRNSHFDPLIWAVGILRLPKVEATTRARILQRSSIGRWSSTFPEARKRTCFKLGERKVSFNPVVQSMSIKKSSKKPPISARRRLLPVN